MPDPARLGLYASSARAMASRLRRRGFTHCTAQQVLVVAGGDSLEDAALESAILQELEVEFDV